MGIQSSMWTYVVCDHASCPCLAGLHLLQGVYVGVSQRNRHCEEQKGQLTSLFDVQPSFLGPMISAIITCVGLDRSIAVRGMWHVVTLILPALARARYPHSSRLQLIQKILVRGPYIVTQCLSQPSICHVAQQNVQLSSSSFHTLNILTVTPHCTNGWLLHMLASCHHAHATLKNAGSGLGG